MGKPDSAPPAITFNGYVIWYSRKNYVCLLQLTVYRRSTYINPLLHRNEHSWNVRNLNQGNNHMNLQQLIIEELSSNFNKISPTFINSIVSQSTTQYFQLTPNMRVCVITLPTGHEVLGKAQVLDVANDVEEIGNKVALTNATNELWALVGTIAKLYI